MCDVVVRVKVRVVLNMEEDLGVHERTFEFRDGCGHGV